MTEASRRKETELAARLDVLGIEPDELAAILRDRYPVELVEQWIAGTASPDAEAKVYLRLIFDPEREHAAQLAAEKVRKTFHRTYADGDRGALELSQKTVGPPRIDGEHYGEVSP